MIIKKAEFITSMTEYKHMGGKPEIALVGRSNVGKSSLINMLAQQKKLARTSNEPGRTRLINYFNFNDTFMLVDLPGYGFAKGAKSEQEKWGKMIEDYILNSKELKHVFVLVDIRHEPCDNDRLMLNYLYRAVIPFTIIATKADKLSGAQLNGACQVITAALGVGRDNIIITSSEKRTGKEHIIQKIDSILQNEKNKD